MGKLLLENKKKVSGEERERTSSLPERSVLGPVIYRVVLCDLQQRCTETRQSLPMVPSYLG